MLRAPSAECSSGLADPGPIVQTFLKLENAGSRFRLDGFVTVVDAKNIHFHLGSSQEPSSPSQKQHRLKNTLSKVFGHRREAWRQLAFADHVVINKVSGGYRD